MDAYLGELAALGTSLAFSVTSTMFTLAGRQVGSTVVNRTRLVLAVLLLCLIHWVLFGNPLPWQAEPQRWLWLGLSGIVGLVLGDAFLFQAFIWIGPRLSMLMMSLAPLIAALVAWTFLDERLSPGQIFGMLLTLAGTAWVILDRQGNTPKPDRDYVHNSNYGRGILFGLGAATGQALGLVLAKNGLGSDFSPISGNLIRMLTAMLALWGIALFQRQARHTLDRLRSSRQAFLFLTVGAIAGPLIGVSLSLLAVQKAEIGVASALMALPPVFLLPISYFFLKERFGWGAVIGTFVAIAGVAFLFLV